MELREIEYGTDAYNETLELRNKVMRLPLGMSIYNEDKTNEAKSKIIGAYEGDQLLGIGILSPTDSDKKMKLDFLCVDSELQKSGVGRTILTHLEEYAVSQGANEIELEARYTAKDFYKKLGYETFGDIYLLDCAPVDHIKMNKVMHTL